MKEIFANTDIGLMGLIFFFLFFCAIAIWTFRPGAKKKYEELGQIPLEEKN
ncbi:MAG: cbb3-type cytochrome c oxidase subunit 3 [Alphaproteobacteria bacterium]|nr:cbb3-type cytochrome c oxidase subunit 3 [Alphaproteobacteria bacterium]